MSNNASLKERIEKMTVTHQVEILRILKNEEGVTTNENSNGTFVNLTAQPPEVVEKLEAYVRYVQDQQDRLSQVEAEKERLQQEYFNGAKAAATD
jgi:hypothetical protein